MRAMKDSGVEWIGFIPITWHVQRGKTLFSQRMSKGNKEEILLAATQKYGMYPQSMLEGVVQVKEETDLQIFRTVHKNDYVISLRSFQGGFEISDYEGVCSPAYQVFYNKLPIDYGYYKYLFKSDGFVSKMNSLTIGIREGKNILFSDFANSIIPIPSIDDQRHITDFLNTKCAQIDTIIEKQKQVIEKLKEYKQSVITEAVTKGLDPNVPMKDSGVEWIGTIPENWTMVKLKHVCTFINGDRSNNYPSPNDFNDDGLPFYGANSLDGRYVDSSIAKHITETKYLSMGGVKLQKGDSLYTLRGSTIGKNALVQVNGGTVASSLMAIRPIIIDALYLSFILNSRIEQYQREELINGSTAPNLSAENVRGFFIPIPDINEQMVIAKRLDNVINRLDNALKKKDMLIKHITIYKKSLIYEAVTGKVEV